MRRLILIEDHKSVAESACHARGLILFCRENLNLRVERHVGLWTTVFRLGGAENYGLMHSYAEQRSRERDRFCNARLQACTISKAVSNWLAETQILSYLGMLQSIHIRVSSTGPPKDIYTNRNDALVRYNFPLETPHDPEEILEQMERRTLQKWQAAWNFHEPSNFQTAPPVPPWHILHWARVLH